MANSRHLVVVEELPDAAVSAAPRDPVLQRGPSPSAEESRRPSARTETVVTFGCIASTLAASGLFAHELVGHIVEHVALERWLAATENVVVLIVVAALIYGNLVYQAARLGEIRRCARLPAADGPQPENIFGRQAPRLTVLVPSYREEAEMVFMTLLSAALLEYPHKQVVLLIDDPPNPIEPPDEQMLRAARALPERIRSVLAEPEAVFAAELAAFHRRVASGTSFAPEELRRLQSLQVQAARYFDDVARQIRTGDHVGDFFVREILQRPAEGLRRRAEAMSCGSLPGETMTEHAFEREYQRLAGFFSADVISFERKQYSNLSHAANKAMNLNSYIGLMGSRVKEVIAPDGRKELVRCETNSEGYQVFDADYLITLDADSLLLGGYALRLINVLEDPENRRMAIAQTPYSAYPNPPSALERIAGATTDIQHIVHEGFTHYDGTYWVGANAVIRKKALLDIASVAIEDGVEVTKYIQDRTVIEDTESTVDLLAKGWSLYNYPARLAYSATPPDFGALLIQRRRWANGGLIILPKLLRCLRRMPLGLRTLMQGFVQIHYLTSLAITSFGVLALVLYPFEEGLRSPWLPLTALPYFYCISRDLLRTGYRRRDVFAVYALNLALLPVHLGGVLKSLRQILTGRKSPFGRTPKVDRRTSVPKLYLFAILGFLAYCIANAIIDLSAARWAHAIFAFVNAACLCYAIIVYLRPRSVLEDLGLPLVNLLSARIPVALRRNAP